MANSILIPFLEMPPDISKVRSVINASLSEFKFPPARVWIDKQDSVPVPLTDSFIMIEGQQEHDQCWISISECAPELTGDEECPILADVKTRGSWLFAGIVAYALCKHWGRVVFNDAGELDGKESYSAASLKVTLVEEIGKADR